MGPLLVIFGHFGQKCDLTPLGPLGGVRILSDEGATRPGSCRWRVYPPLAVGYFIFLYTLKVRGGGSAPTPLSDSPPKGENSTTAT